jgi:hypothetical protein
MDMRFSGLRYRGVPRHRNAAGAGAGPRAQRCAQKTSRLRTPRRLSVNLQSGTGPGRFSDNPACRKTVQTDEEGHLYRPVATAIRALPHGQER